MLEPAWSGFFGVEAQSSSIAQANTSGPETEEAIKARLEADIKRKILEDCQSSYNEYQTALETFHNACGDASLGGRDTSCKEQIELCFKCAGIGAKKAREQKKLADECGTLEKEAFLPIRNSHQQTALTSLLDLANGRAPMLQAQTPRRPIQTASLPMKTYQNCPAYAARDLETIEDKLREDEKEKNRIDSEVKRLERDVSRKETEIKREEAKFEQKINGLKKSFEQQNDALMKVKTEEFEGLQNTLNELVDGLQKLSMARLEAQQKHEDEMQKSVLERCLIQSKSKVQKEREQQLKQISAQTYKTSSLRSLLKRADMSQSKRSRSQLSKYAKACRGSESTQLIVTRLKRAYKTQQKVLNSKEEQIKQMYKTTIDKIGQVQPALQQELKRLQQQQMQSLQEAQTFFVKNQQLLQEELANLKRQLQELLFELQFIESQHAYRAGLASKLQSYSAGAKGERANVYSKISSQYSSLENAYGSAVSQCKCKDCRQQRRREG